MQMLLSEHTALMVLSARLLQQWYDSCSSGILSDQTSQNIKCIWTNAAGAAGQK